MRYKVCRNRHSKTNVVLGLVRERKRSVRNIHEETNIDKQVIHSIVRSAYQRGEIDRHRYSGGHVYFYPVKESELNINDWLAKRWI